MLRFLILGLLISSPAMAQLQIDNGIRNPQSMVVSGDSVIDNDTNDRLSYKERRAVENAAKARAAAQAEIIEQNNGLPTVQDTDLSAEDMYEQAFPMETDAGVQAGEIMPAPESLIQPIDPLSPSAPEPQRRRVIKAYNDVKIQRSITDERIDDSYVQEMVKDNFYFTPTVQ